MKPILLSVLILSLSPCLAQDPLDKKSAKKLAKEEAYQKSINKADSARFLFVAQFATPQTGGNIVLTGPDYDLKINGDSIEVFLPYFGVSRIAPDYGTADRGIKYKGILTDYSVGKNTKKKRVIVTFKSKSHNQEVYRYTVYLGAGDDASLTVSSSHRDQVSFTGDLFAIKEE